MTTYAKLFIFFLSIWLMSSSELLMAQQDVLETSTEAVTETLASTSQSVEAESSFITCDFDLENIENLLPHLPEICTEIYYNRTENDLYNLYLEEAQNFRKFFQKLNDYELRDQPNGDKAELAKYPFETKLRYETYNKVDVMQCLTSALSSATEYLNCLKVKRLELTDLIPSVEKK